MNRVKSSLHPAQVIQHLGFTIDSKSLTLTVPRAKVPDLRREASRLLHRQSCTIRNLEAFIGKVHSMTMTVFPARLKTRHMLTTKIKALKKFKTWSSPIVIPTEAKEELFWWLDHLQSWNGQSFLPSSPQVEIFTDASNSGWGIVEGHNSWSGQWTSEEQSLHINQKELLVIWKALMLQQWTGNNIRVMCDNTTTIAYVNKFGGTRSQALLHLSRRIWNFCLQTDTRLHLQYVASAFNPADSIPPDGSTTRMEDSYQILCPSGPQVGSPHGGYVRSSNQSPSPSLCDLEVRPDSPSDGCNVDGLAANGLTISLPSMESVATSDCQDSERTRYRDTDNPLVDISYLVHSSETNGSTKTTEDSSNDGPSTSRGHHQKVLQENPHWLLAAGI